MSKFPHQPEEEIYPVSTLILDSFLTENGFRPKSLSKEELVLEKDSLAIKLPNENKLTRQLVLGILIEAELSIEAFEHYAVTFLATKYFDTLMDLSLRTRSPKNEKG